MGREHEAVGWVESLSISGLHRRENVIGMKLREVSYGDCVIASGDPPNRVRNRIDIEPEIEPRPSLPPQVQTGMERPEAPTVAGAWSCGKRCASIEMS